MHELDNFKKILEKLKIWKKNARMDSGQIQCQISLIDIIYLCVVLGRYLEFYES